MMKLHKIILSFLLIVLMVIIAGCGKLGEDEAENMVKSHLKVKDSYKKSPMMSTNQLKYLN